MTDTIEDLSTEEIAKHALRKKHISVDDISTILSRITRYSPVLSKFAKKYNLKSVDGFEFNIDTEADKKDLWVDLYGLWCFKTFRGFEYPHDQEALEKQLFLNATGGIPKPEENVKLRARIHNNEAVIRHMNRDRIKPYKLSDNGIDVEPIKRDPDNEDMWEDVPLKDVCLKLDDIRSFFDVLEIALPYELFPDTATTGSDDQDENQPVAPYQGIGLKRAKQCLMEWKNADGLISINTLIDGLVLSGYEEKDIRRIYIQCGYKNWAEIRQKHGWQQMAWSGIAQRLAFNIFLDKAVASTQGDYEPLRVFSVWKESSEKPAPVCVELGGELDEYFLDQFGIHIPPFPTTSYAEGWPDYPCLSTNGSDLKFWNKQSVFFPDNNGFDDPEKLIQKAFRRHKSGAMPIDDLAYTLSQNKGYHSILKGLWGFCGYNSDEAQGQFTKWDDDILKDDSKISRAWFWVLTRLVLPERNSFYFEPLLKEFPIGDFTLNLHRLTDIGEYEPVREIGSYTPDHFIFLDEFQACIKDIKCKYIFLFVDVALPPKSINIERPRFAWPENEGFALDSDYPPDLEFFIKSYMNLEKEEDDLQAYNAIKGYLTDDMQREWGNIALRTGMMSFYKISFSLALSDEYCKLLPGLFEATGFNTESVRAGLPEWHPQILDNVIDRVRAWYWVLTRFALDENRSRYFEGIKFVGAVYEENDNGYSVENYRLGLYQKSNGGNERVDDLHLTPGHLVNLNEFYEVIKNIHCDRAQHFNGVPLPGPLFSSGPTVSQEAGPEPWGDVDQEQYQEAEHCEFEMQYGDDIDGFCEEVNKIYEGAKIIAKNQTEDFDRKGFIHLTTSEKKGVMLGHFEELNGNGRKFDHLSEYIIENSGMCDGNNKLPRDLYAKGLKFYFKCRGINSPNGQELERIFRKRSKTKPPKN